MLSYTKRVLIALDQLLNALLPGGYADETLSARAWRQRCESRVWAFMRRLIDTMLFFDPDHCMNSYINEVTRSHLPGVYRPRRQPGEGKRA